MAGSWRHCVGLVDSCRRTLAGFAVRPQFSDIAGSVFEGSVWDSWLSDETDFGVSTGWLFRIVPSNAVSSCPLSQDISFPLNTPITICGVDVTLNSLDLSSNLKFLKIILLT